MNLEEVMRDELDGKFIKIREGATVTIRVPRNYSPSHSPGNSPHSGWAEGGRALALTRGGKVWNSDEELFILDHMGHMTNREMAAALLVSTQQMKNKAQGLRDRLGIKLVRERAL